MYTAHLSHPLHITACKPVKMALSTRSRPCMSLSSQARAKAVAPVARTTASRPRVAPIVAFRDDKRSAQKGSNKVLGSSSRAGKKQPLVPPLGRAPTNPKENAESVLWFVLVGGFFLTGVLFVTIPALQVGGNAFTQTWQKGVNKSVGIKEPTIAGKGYAPGPGPAAAPESPAAKM